VRGKQHEKEEKAVFQNRIGGVKEKFVTKKIWQKQVKCCSLIQ